jgi:hypothetical protein
MERVSSRPAPTLSATHAAQYRSGLVRRNVMTSAGVARGTGRGAISGIRLSRSTVSNGCDCRGDRSCKGRHAEQHCHHPQRHTHHDHCGGDGQC